ncbi:hypothetical protein [Streptomyces sp. NBC_01443]|uniref:hypothetical protein n=1 Tax=Streptomyces sp. NBC_01443 TaxID=2903868 RepID=UPI0022595F8F|nr:hypothetical protein [Streptomyces sp. NBC_01443]MCX4625176.1 hypothetical protein [Streptomyces sp. NBC_01443]MCX4633541.1 hypothetical protein [Streptomyces sp. NBC_01443]
MHAPWRGTRRLAVIPTLDRTFDTNPPADFGDQVAARLWYDPHPVTGVDRSLRRYIHTISYGLADFEATVFPVAMAPDARTREAAIDSLPAGHGYTDALVVLVSGGSDRSGFAWWHDPPRNGITNTARCNLDEGVGVWGMELLHALPEFGDLYYTDPNLGRFDNMACNCGTHPSAHTKMAMQWLDPATVGRHVHGSTTHHSLHAIGLTQPPTAGRHSAVWISSRVTGRHFLAEARLRVDDYERQSHASAGIPGEGVIVYEVAGTTEVYLRTAVALGVGESFSLGTDEQTTVDVTGEIPGGFTISVQSPEHPGCARLREEIDTIIRALHGDIDLEERRQLIAELHELNRRKSELGCAP